LKTYDIAAIGGDGIGPEVIAAGIEALDALARRDGGFAFRFEHFCPPIDQVLLAPQQIDLFFDHRQLARMLNLLIGAPEESDLHVILPILNLIELLKYLDIQCLLLRSFKSQPSARLYDQG